MNEPNSLEEMLGDNSLDDLLKETSEILAKQHLTEVEVERIIEASEYKHPD